MYEKNVWCGIQKWRSPLFSVKNQGASYTPIPERRLLMQSITESVTKAVLRSKFTEHFCVNNRTNYPAFDSFATCKNVRRLVLFYFAKINVFLGFREITFSLTSPFFQVDKSTIPQKYSKTSQIFATSCWISLWSNSTPTIAVISGKNDLGEKMKSPQKTRNEPLPGNVRKCLN